MNESIYIKGREVAPKQYVDTKIEESNSRFYSKSEIDALLNEIRANLSASTTVATNAEVQEALNSSVTEEVTE